MPISGIAGSIAGRGVWEAGRHAYQTAAHWRYAQLFGSDATSGRLHLVVGALVPLLARIKRGTLPVYLQQAWPSERRILNLCGDSQL